MAESKKVDERELIDRMKEVIADALFSGDINAVSSHRKATEIRDALFSWIDRLV